MANLPSSPFTLTGGCFCNAIKYTLSVPELSSRPKLPDPPSATMRTLGPQDEITQHLPIISLDHCNSCCRVTGSLVQCWFICPQSWMQFSLLPKSPSHPAHFKVSDSDANLNPESSDRIEPDIFAVLKGDEKLKESTYLSHFCTSEDRHRVFCGRCGTHLTFHYTGKSRYPTFPPIFDIAMGTMDEESRKMEGLGARRQGHVQDGHGWFQRLLKDGEGKFEG